MEKEPRKPVPAEDEAPASTVVDERPSEPETAAPRSSFTRDYPIFGYE